MTTSWRQPITQYGQTTSLDVARNQTFSTTTIAGVKRRRDQLYPDLQQDAVIQNLSREVGGHPQQSIAEPHPSTGLQARRVRKLPLQHTSSLCKDPHIVISSVQLPSTPGLSQNPLLSLRHPRYALPSKLVDNLESLGVQTIYPWQSTCLLGKRILNGEQNLIYSAPTGGGKSLVADVLMIKQVIDNPGKKAILVLPYVALVQEKLRWLRSVVDGVEKKSNEQPALHASTVWWQNNRCSITVAGLFGGSQDRATWSGYDIAVCTIEKANALVNSAIEEGTINQLGIIVFDELHMLDDENRGYILELMATKLMTLQCGIQIVGMSATISNPKLLAEWLQAKYYISKYQPIPIEEYLVYDNCIYPTANSKEFFRTANQLSSDTIPATQKPALACQTIDLSAHKELDNPLANSVVALAIETVVAGYSALVFCGSRLSVENTALLISDAMPPNSVLEIKELRRDVLASLRALPGGFEAAFRKTIVCGVGFHHAGLTVEERDIVAAAYDSGILRVMVATCSLAAGINLPARRVILHGARMGRDLVGPAMLRQMRGRAGRKGKDEVGETYLCCAKADLESVAALLEAEMPPVSSCLTPEKRGVKRALLEVIATRLASSRGGLEEYIRKSLLWQTTDHKSVSDMFDTAIGDLISANLIQQPLANHPAYDPTPLGCAIVASSLTPDDGIFVHSEMQRALSSFVMDGEFHSFYLFTPLPSTSTAMETISWPTFRDQLNRLTEPDMRAIRLIGISPALVNKLAQSGATSLPSTTSQADDERTTRIYRRAYSALQLRDLCAEVPIHSIALKYSVPRGAVQTLSQTCHGFAAGMVKFCARMGSSYALLGAVLEHMIDRLRAGARADLLELAQVTFVKSRMARLLWENGFKSVQMLAEARVEDIVPVMMAAQSGKFRRKGVTSAKEALAEEERLREKVKAKAEVIVRSAGRVYERMMVVELDE